LHIFSIELLILEDEGLVGCSVFVELGSGRFNIYVVNEVKGDIFDIVKIIVIISESLEVFLAAVEACSLSQQSV